MENKKSYSKEKLQDLIKVLIQGVSVIFHRFDRSLKLSVKVRQFIWLDSYTSRLCIARKIPKVGVKLDYNKKPYHGLYLRDISEVRDGIHSYDFQNTLLPPDNPDHCLCIIGSEGTISLEMLSKVAKDWLSIRFRLLISEFLTPEEHIDRAYRIWNHDIALYQILAHRDSQEQVVFKELISNRGIQVLVNLENGKIENGIIKYIEAANCLELYTPYHIYFMTFKNTKSLHLCDISEIRLGSHSFGFSQSVSTSNHTETASIIGSSATLNLQFINQLSRDTFMSRLFTFILIYGNNITDMDGTRQSGYQYLKKFMGIDSLLEFFHTNILHNTQEDLKEDDI